MWMARKIFSCIACDRADRLERVVGAHEVVGVHEERHRHAAQDHVGRQLLFPGLDRRLEGAAVRAGVREELEHLDLAGGNAGRLRRLDAGEVLALDRGGLGEGRAARRRARHAAAAERRVAEKRRRFMFVFMEKATVEGGFAPTRQVPRRRRAGARAPMGGALQRGCTLMRIAATGWPTSRSRCSRCGTSWRSLAATAALAHSSDQPSSSTGPALSPRGERRPGRPAPRRRTGRSTGAAARRAGRAGRWRAAPRRSASATAGGSGLGRHRQSLAAGPGW